MQKGHRIDSPASPTHGNAFFWGSGLLQLNVEVLAEQIAPAQEGERQVVMLRDREVSDWVGLDLKIVSAVFGVEVAPSLDKG